MSAERVILLRHARTGHNADGRFQGQLDIALDDVGRAQAARSAAALADQLRGPVCVVSSDLVRAASTAQMLADRLDVPVQHDERLREIHGGAWQGLLAPQIVAGWPQEYRIWQEGDVFSRRPGGGESRVEAGRRVHAALEEHDAKMDGGTLVCVVHGASSRAALWLMLFGEPPWPWGVLEGLRNAHWCELSHPATGWRLHTWNAGPPAKPHPVPRSGTRPP